MEKWYRFLPCFFTAFLLLVVYCFWQSYFGHFPDFQDVISPIDKVTIAITSVTHFHAAAIVLWLLMLIVQPILIIRKKFDWHRILGKVSYVLVALIVLSLCLIVRQEQIRVKHLNVFAANLFDVPLFIIYYCLAIYFRKKPAYHSRFIMLTILPLLDPALARLNAQSLPIQMSLWLLFFGIEFFNSKVYKPYLIGLGFFVFNLAIVAYLFLFNQPLLNSIWQFFFG